MTSPIVWDKEQKGLHIRTAKSGCRSYYVKYRTRWGQERRPKIANCDDMTLTQAREIAKNLMARVALGGDPRREWIENQQAATISEVWGLVESKHYSQKRFQESGWAKEASRLYTRHVAKRFGPFKLAEITVAEVQDWLASFESIYSANRSLEVLSLIFSFAQKREIYLGTNPCKKVDAFSEKKRRRFASLDEIKRLAEILNREAPSHPREVAFLYLLLFTGSRPRLLERAKWKDLKCVGDVGVLRLPGKTFAETGEEDVVVIPNQCLRLLLSISESRNENDTLTGISMPQTFWARIRKEAGCEDLWARDFRRTFATVALSMGVGKDQVSELLNHRSVQTTNIYAKLFDQTRIDAAVMIADRMEELTRVLRQA